jgi:hypothetical protein
VSEDSAPDNEVHRAVKLEQEQLARLERVESAGSAWLSEVHLVEFDLLR